jgi:hypothetical protein
MVRPFSVSISSASAQSNSGTLSRVDQKLEDLTKPPASLPRRP